MVSVEVDERCRSLEALQHAIAAEIPGLDIKEVCLSIGGCEMDDDAVCSLSDGSVVDVAATCAAQARLTLREEGCDPGLMGFRRAAKAGNLRQCELYVLGGVAPDEACVLHDACESGNVALCELLIDKGYPKGYPAWGITPLYIAAFIGSVELCRLLIKRARCPRAAVNARAMQGRTPLRAAVEKNHVEVCRLLIANGCEVGGTVLHYAVEARSVEMCRLLIDAGCPLDVVDRRERTPLAVAFNAKSYDLCTLLIESGCRVDDTMLLLSAMSSEIRQLLLDAQRNRRLRTSEGLPPAAPKGAEEGRTALTDPTSPGAVSSASCPRAPDSVGVGDSPHPPPP